MVSDLYLKVMSNIEWTQWASANGLSYCDECKITILNDLRESNIARVPCQYNKYGIFSHVKDHKIIRNVLSKFGTLDDVRILRKISNDARKRVIKELELE